MVRTFHTGHERHAKECINFVQERQQRKTESTRADEQFCCLKGHGCAPMDSLSPLVSAFARRSISQFYQGDLRRTHEPPGQQDGADAAIDIEGGFAKVKKTPGIAGTQGDARCQRPDQGQTDLSSMRVAAQHEIDAILLRRPDKIRRVRQKD